MVILLIIVVIRLFSDNETMNMHIVYFKQGLVKPYRDVWESGDSKVKTS